VLYEMLTGRGLFDGETVSETLAAVLTKDPDWTQLPPGTPPNLHRVLRLCLDRDVKRRLRDMGDAWIELNTPDEVVRPPASGKPSFTTGWLPWIAAAIVAVAAVASSFLRKPATQPHPVVHSAFTQEKLFGVPSLSRDGTRLVYTQVESGANQVMMRRLDQLEARPIPGAESAIYAVFSPDSQWLAYYSAGPAAPSLMKIPVTGGPPVEVCQCSAGSGISWGDSHSVIFSDGKSLFLVSDTGGAPQSLTTPDQRKGELAHRSPFLLPGAKAVLFSIIVSGSSQVALLDLKRGGYHVIVSNGTSPQYNSAGYLTYVRAGALIATPFDIQRLQPTGPETNIIQGVSGVSSAGGEYSVSDNGVLVYMAGQYQGGKSTLGWVDRKGVQQQLSEPQFWGTGRLSPDGLRIVDAIRGDGDLADIWIFDVERRTLTRLTFGGSNSSPIWTPDARHITYTARISGNDGIYSVPSDGSGKPELLMATEGRAIPCSWTPDGKMLIYSQTGSDKKSHLWTFTVAGNGAMSRPARLHDTSSVEFDAEISPDGRNVAYVSNESGAAEVYVQAFPGPGAKVRISTQGGVAPRWSRTPRELLYWLPSSYSMDRTALVAVDIQLAPVFHAGIPQELFKQRVGTTWDVAPDGKHFLTELLPTGTDVHMETVVNWFTELQQRVPTR
jgi:serine/threonine-protein kinase